MFSPASISKGGWPHCFQDQDLTQEAIDRRQTLIAFESMNLWSDNGSFKTACVP
jgi:hypothetical protein